MNKEELLKLKENYTHRKSNIKNDIQAIKLEDEEFDLFLINSISFKPSEIAKIICLLIFSLENKEYIPLKEISSDNMYKYLTLIPYKEYKEKGLSNFKSYNDKISLYSLKNNQNNANIDNEYSFTFEHLLAEYNLKHKNLNDKYLHVFLWQFMERPYVRHFISILAELQAKNNGEHLTEEEMLNVMSDFINLEKEKKKELTKKK